MPSDELMLATLSLAAAARPMGAQDPPSNMKVLSPLATAQSLHVYGTMNVESAYRRVLFFMLKQRGGLGRVQLYGLAEGIELSETLSANFACFTELQISASISLLPPYHASHRSARGDAVVRTSCSEIVNLISRATVRTPDSPRRLASLRLSQSLMSSECFAR
jgi:hypothetical protein